MPANEKTWRDMKLMHTVFGVSSVILLIATVWMFAADHVREWKGHQRTYRTVERELGKWRLEADADANANLQEELEQKLRQVQAGAPPKDLVDRFKAEVQADAERRNAGAPDFSRLDRRYEQLTSAAGSSAGAGITQQPASPGGATTAANGGVGVTQFTALQGEEAAAGGSDAAKADDAGAASSDANAEVDTEVDRSLVKARKQFMDVLDGFVQQARFREDTTLTDRKFMAARFDVAKADRGLAVRDGKLEDPTKANEVAELDQRIEDVRADLDKLTKDYQEAAQHRKNLQAIMGEIAGAEEAVKKEIKDAEAEQTRLDDAIFDRTSTFFTNRPPFLGKKWIELPILDAFNSPLKIDNLWTDGLTMPNGSFGQVRRFDRCTTCHRAIDKTQSGSAVDPLFEGQHEVELTLATPAEAPTLAEGESLTLEKVYGIELAEVGLLERDDVTVRGVVPGSPASKAEAVNGGGDIGLLPGDVIAFVGGDKVLSPKQASEFLLTDVKWGTPKKITVLRGLPHPYASHPRLDLFVGSLSPHTLAKVGCTVCHEGQGSGTEFKWTSHTPNDQTQRDQWRKDEGWFNNHHWILPMYPQRFAESGCLKCHHDVVELYPSERFPEAPAPKVTQGWNLISDYGCFGCHEINGYKSKTERIGPDMRLEPNFHEVAAALRVDGGFAKLSAEVQQAANDLIYHPDRDDLRALVRTAVSADELSEEPVLAKSSHELGRALNDIEIPGTLRKVGPSLRHVKDKVGASFLYDWIQDPKHFRPSTKMPKFFGNHAHLTPEELPMVQQFEQAEILGIVTYLMANSQPMEKLEAGETKPVATDADMVARGKVLFETRGCLACHSHADFPAATANQGPNLTNIGDKFALADTPDAAGWLFTWLKNPNLYHPRTSMPNLILDPITQADGTVTDPAADIAAYLLASKTGWQPAAGNAAALELVSEQSWRAPDGLRRAVKDLALEHLNKAFYLDQAKQYLEQGIPAEVGKTLKGAEIEMVGGATPQNLLRYVGRKAIGKYGCYACHDVPGFEDAKPIGTALADWGRKESAKLAFEHILEYLAHGHGHGGPAVAAGEAHGTGAEHGADSRGHGTTTGHEDVELGPDGEPFDEGFYHQALMDHERTGFVWQKLKEPRSYDFEKYGADPTTYNDRLRMPQFPFSAEQREAVVTFVLGLVADPPAEKFVYQPDARKQALNEGRLVLEKYNCGGCHILEAERWDVEFPTGTFEPQSEVATYPFLKPNMTKAEIEASLAKHAIRQTHQASLYGLPGISDDEAKPVVWEDIGLPIADPLESYDPKQLFYPFELWKPAVLEGNTYDTGVNLVPVPGSAIRQKYPALGGDLTRILLPRVLEIERETNAAAKGTEAWGWLPPPLIGEGNKVQPDWLHNFLLDPHPIRPAAFLRMPKFNMSSAEASQLVNYFAARDNAEFPYSYDSRTRSSHLVEREQAYQQSLGSATEKPRGGTRLEHAMNIVVDNTYCIKCHLVGDFQPEGSDRAKAPNLVDVQARLRPDYLRDWIANPKRILPYTPMPVNIPYDGSAPNLGGVPQRLYHGTSVDQLDGLVDLLMNYSRFTEGQTNVNQIVKEAAEAAGAAGAGGTGASESGATGAAATDGATSGNSGSGSGSE